MCACPQRWVLRSTLPWALLPCHYSIAGLGRLSSLAEAACLPDPQLCAPAEHCARARVALFAGAHQSQPVRLLVPAYATTGLTSMHAVRLLGRAAVPAAAGAQCLLHGTPVRHTGWPAVRGSHQPPAFPARRKRGRPRRQRAWARWRRSPGRPWQRHGIPAGAAAGHKRQAWATHVRPRHVGRWQRRQRRRRGQARLCSRSTGQWAALVSAAHLLSACLLFRPCVPPSPSAPSPARLPPLFSTVLPLIDGFTQTVCWAKCSAAGRHEQHRHEITNRGQQ